MLPANKLVHAVKYHICDAALVGSYHRQSVLHGFEQYEKKAFVFLIGKEYEDVAGSKDVFLSSTNLCLSS